MLESTTEMMTMTNKITLGAAFIALIGGVSACSIESNENPAHEASASQSAPLLDLGVPTLGDPGVFYFTGAGLNAASLVGQLVPAGITMVADSDIVTEDDGGGAPSLSDFPQAIDLLGRSYRKIGAYPDESLPPVPVPLADGSMGSHPFQRYVEAKPGAVLRKSTGTGADGSAIVPAGMSLRVVVINYANVPQSSSTLPTNVPGLQGTTRVATTMLYKCAGYRPATTECVNAPNATWTYLSAGRTDYIFATANGLSFRYDGSAIDGNQYFKLNDAGTAYQQVVYAGTAYKFSQTDYKYLQTNYGYASWTPIIADSMPWFFSRP
jgi:hypothetical protein